MTDKQIVYRVEDGMDRQAILCTTYQMRNFYRQLGDGFFSVLDIMNYIQHHQVVRMIKRGDRVLDMACGRGLLLPLLRYHRKEIAEYVGVDIYPKNAIFLEKRVTDGKSIADLAQYYPFPVYFVESDVAEMSAKLDGVFDFIVYTASIEHMHRDHGAASLVEARKVAAPDATLFITCPNTPPDKDGYETQYRAHVYEWKRDELVQALAESGWRVVREFGLLMRKKDLKLAMVQAGLGRVFHAIDANVPPEWYIPVLSSIFPKQSREIGFVCEAA